MHLNMYSFDTYLWSNLHQDCSRARNRAGGMEGALPWKSMANKHGDWPGRKQTHWVYSAISKTGSQGHIGQQEGQEKAV